MHVSLSLSLSSILLLSTSLLSFTSALPTATADAEASPLDLVPRACTTINPSFIDVLDKNDPNKPHNSNTFTLARSGPGATTKKSVVTFNNIPAGSTGCMLSIQWPALPNFQENSIATGTGTQSDVWSVAPDPNGVSTWNHPPALNQFVSTTIFPTGTSPAFKTFLYSNSCSPTMSFLFQLSDWQQGGGNVNFVNSVIGSNKLPIGLSMVYNC